METLLFQEKWFMRFFNTSLRLLRFNNDENNILFQLILFLDEFHFLFGGKKASRPLYKRTKSNFLFGWAWFNFSFAIASPQTRQYYQSQTVPRSKATTRRCYSRVRYWSEFSDSPAFWHKNHSCRRIKSNMVLWVINFTSKY